jgi:HNH endonuclease
MGVAFGRFSSWAGCGGSQGSSKTVRGTLARAGGPAPRLRSAVRHDHGSAATGSTLMATAGRNGRFTLSLPLLLLFNRLMPDSDSYPVVIAEVVARLVRGDRAGAERSMAAIAYPRREASTRPGIPRPLMIRVFGRDCWTCRYCGRRTIYSPVMPLLGVIFPEHFPYHPNWKAGQTHPAVAECTASVDHVVPGSPGGAWLEESNLVTACWPCNASKGNLTLGQLGWQLRAVDESSWDGLYGFYPQLQKIARELKHKARPQWHQAQAAGATAGDDGKGRSLEPAPKGGASAEVKPAPVSPPKKSGASKKEPMGPSVYRLKYGDHLADDQMAAALRDYIEMLPTGLKAKARKQGLHLVTGQKALLDMIGWATTVRSAQAKVRSALTA